MAEVSDKSLIEAHLRGETAAFESIVRRYGDGLLGYLIKMTGNREQAEDLFQETFRRVHEKAHTFRGRSFKSWMFTIANRLVIDGYRKQARRATVSLDGGCCDGDGCCGGAAVVEADCDEPAKRAIDAENMEKVRAAVDQLAKQQKATLILAYYQGLTYAEVAQVLDCSVGSVKRHMYRALRTLADKLPDVSGVVE